MNNNQIEKENVMKKPLVGILMGSDSDLPVMRKAAEVLKEMGVPCEMDICSAPSAG